MLRIARHIRRKLLRDNRIIKYLVYALGEIILVVAGILIALAINNKNEQRINNERTLTLLREIQADLILDLEEVQRMSKNYHTVRRYADIIVNPKVHLKEEDLEDPMISKIGTYIDYMKIDSRGFENFMQRSDQLSIEFDSIRDKLQFLYQRFAEFIEIANQQLRKTVDEQNNFVNAQLWEVYQMNTGKISAEESAYYLGDDYKRYIINYNRRRYVLYRESLGFRLHALKVYKEIDSILNNSVSSLPDHVSGKLSEEEALNFSGDYVSPDGKRKILFYEENGQNFANYSNNGTDHEILKIESCGDNLLSGRSSKLYILKMTSDEIGSKSIELWTGSNETQYFVYAPLK